MQFSNRSQIAVFDRQKPARCSILKKASVFARRSKKHPTHALLHPKSISIGIATYPQHGGNTNELVDVAEAALKPQKRKGRIGLFWRSKST
jgi:GGDEF domain-containing protein